MKIKFKDLRNSRIKIEKFHEQFGTSNFIEICCQYDIAPNDCINNSWKLADLLNLNGVDFEFVECVLRFECEGEMWVKPHAISYWNGHYFDFTLEIMDVYNSIQDEIYIIPDNAEVIPIRRFNRDEIHKFIKYCDEADENTAIPYMSTNIWIDKTGVIQPADIKSPWIYKEVYGEKDVKCCKEEDFKKYMY